jgi:hypothetical protein
LATLVGQDLDEGVDGVFRIARRVAKDRVIYTVDPQARHWHKTAAHGFDGFKGPDAIDPDSGAITATAVTAGNTGDAASAGDLLAADLPAADAGAPEVSGDDDRLTDQAGAEPGQCIEPATVTASSQAEGVASMEAPLAIYGDAAYGAGALLEELEAAGADIMTKVQPPVAQGAGSPRTGSSSTPARAP